MITLAAIADRGNPQNDARYLHPPVYIPSGRMSSGHWAILKIGRIALNNFKLINCPGFVFVCKF